MKNIILTAKIDRLSFPCTGISAADGEIIKIKDALPGQTVSARIKRKGGKTEARLLEVLGKAEYETESPCPHFGVCNGCRFLTMAYEKQLAMKEQAVLALFRERGVEIGEYHGIAPSPEAYGYRNKMEFSFGDTGLGGELSLGLRIKNSFYEVCHVSECVLIGEEMREILKKTLGFFRDSGLPYYNTRRAEGVLRHLVVRESKYSGELLVNLVTAAEIAPDLLCGYKTELSALNAGVAGILHTVNTSPADTVKLDDIRVLYGREYIYEQILGMKFRITPQSFFQTNSLGAEILYKMALSFAGSPGTAFDLYCGAGTISLLLAARAKKVYGIEIVPEAVTAAKEAAERNSVSNVSFICGDVLAECEPLAANEKPDLVVLDPPRAGVHPKALKKIIAFEAGNIVYVSCNPATLANDLKIFAESGYSALNLALVDMFPWTPHVECVVNLSK